MSRLLVPIRCNPLHPGSNEILPTSRPTIQHSSWQAGSLIHSLPWSPPHSRPLPLSPLTFDSFGSLCRANLFRPCLPPSALWRHTPQTSGRWARTPSNAQRTLFMAPQRGPNRCRGNQRGNWTTRGTVLDSRSAQETPKAFNSDDVRAQAGIRPFAGRTAPRLSSHPYPIHVRRAPHESGRRDIRPLTRAIRALLPSPRRVRATGPPPWASDAREAVTAIREEPFAWALIAVNQPLPSFQLTTASCGYDIDPDSTSNDECPMKKLAHRVDMLDKGFSDPNSRTPPALAHNESTAPLHLFGRLVEVEKVEPAGEDRLNQPSSVSHLRPPPSVISSSLLRSLRRSTPFRPPRTISPNPFSTQVKSVLLPPRSIRPLSPKSHSPSGRHGSPPPSSLLTPFTRITVRQSTTRSRLTANGFSLGRWRRMCSVSGRWSLVSGE